MSTSSWPWVSSRQSPCSARRTSSASGAGGLSGGGFMSNRLEGAQDVEQPVPLVVALPAEVRGCVAGYVWSGHARAVHARRGVARHGRGDLLAGCDEVWLRASVPGGTAGREIRHPIGMGLQPVCGADREHDLGVAGVRDRDGPVALARRALMGVVG